MEKIFGGHWTFIISTLVSKITLDGLVCVIILMVSEVRIPSTHSKWAVSTLHGHSTGQGHSVLNPCYLIEADSSRILNNSNSLLQKWLGSPWIRVKGTHAFCWLSSLCRPPASLSALGTIHSGMNWLKGSGAE